MVPGIWHDNHLPRGPVVWQQRQPHRARCGLGRVAVAGSGGGVEVGAAQAGCRAVDLDAVIGQDVGVEDGQRVQRCLG